MGSGLDWTEICESFSPDYFCLAIDLPGHGKSTAMGNQSDYSMKRTQSLIIDFLNKININTCHLMGYSMGGRIAFLLAIHFPEYFNKIVIESASPGIESSIERNQRLRHDEELAKKLETVNFENFLSAWYDQPLFNTLKNRENFANLLKLRLNNNPVELAKSLRGMSPGKQPALWDKLHLIKNDALLIAGEFDQKYRDIVKLTQRKIKFSTTAIIKNCGHNVHFEKRDEFIKRIKKFLNADPEEK